MSRTIGINTLFLIPNEVGGTEYYTRSFLRELEKQDKINRHIVFCNRENFDSFVFENPLWQKVLCDVSGRNRLVRIVYEQCVLPFVILRHECTVLHSFGYVAPWLSPAVSIITVHDANWKDHPSDIPLLPRLVLNVLMAGSLFTAKKVITDSDFSLKRLQFHYPQYSDKLLVIEPGLDEQFLQLLASDQKLPKGLKKPFLLCVSGLYPHKRVPYLLELWEKLQETFPEYELVLVGRNGSDGDFVTQRGKEIPRVHLLPKVSLPELVALYQHAQVCVQPSVYEGFGFPVYEALSAGAPVIVGKKECFSQEVQNVLSELTFSHVEDVKLIEQSLKKKRKVLRIGDYSQKAAKLLTLYSQV